MTAPLRVGVIGAGRVGTALGTALTAAGHEPVPAGPAADLVLLTVPDDALAGVAAGLATRPGQVVAHTAGSHGLAVLEPATRRGARPMVLHPAMTFTGQPTDLDRLPGISYGVTAPDGLRPFATRLVADLGGTVEWVADADRPLYHAALAHGANHLMTLVNDAADQLREAGVREPARLLAPLLHAAVDNALAGGDAALTGPVARGDAGTVARHVSTLDRSAPGSAPAYVALARRTVARAHAAGRLTEDSAGRLLDALYSQEAVSGPARGVAW